MAEPARKQPPVSRWVRVVVGAALFNVAVIAGGNAYEIASASSATFATADAVPAATVAIVPGNLVFAGGGVSSELHGRLVLALTLYKMRKVETIFVSGLTRPADAYDEAAVMAAWLVKRGVPEKDVVIDHNGYRTAATMADAVANGARDVIICTQGYHLPRALFLARRAGLHATGVPAGHPPAGFLDRLRPFLREGLARPESVIEIAFLGVRGRATAPAVLGPKS